MNENDEPPTGYDVAAAWFVTALVWAPVVMHATGTFVPFLRFMFESTIEPMGAVFDRALEENGSLVPAESSSTATPTPTPAVESTPDRPQSPGAIVIVGLVQIIVVLILAVLALGAMGAVGLLGLGYLYLLISAPIMAVSETQEYLNHRRGVEE